MSNLRSMCNMHSFQMCTFLATNASTTRGSRGGNHNNVGFLSNTGLDPLNNHEATKPAINVWPSLTRQRNAMNGVSLAGQLSVVFGSSLPSSTKKHKQTKTMSKFDPL